MKKLKIVLASALCLFAFGQVLAETVTWNVTGTGDWSVKENWTPQQVPTSGDDVIFPDLGADYTVTVNDDYTVKSLAFSACANIITTTLAGTGSITATGSGEKKVEGRHRLVIDGVTVRMEGNSMMLYSACEVKNGATFSTGENILYVHQSDSSLTVTGGHVICGTLQHSANAMRTFIRLDGGSIKATSFGRYYDGERSFDFTITDGVFEIGQLNVTKPFETLRMTGGAIRITGGYNLEGGKLDLTGGTIELSYDFTDFSFARIFDLVNGTKVDTSKGTLTATSNEALSYPGAVTVGGLKNGFSDYGAFAVDEIAFAGGTTAPFTYTGKYDYKLFLQGPTTLRALADMTPPASDMTVLLHGAVTVDTADKEDASVKRTFVLDGAASDEGSAALRVTGGGTLKMMTRERLESFTAVRVAEETTLDLIPPTDGTSVRGHLKTETFALGANATLKIVAGDSFVEASDWTIDPTAKIVVTVPAGFEDGACAILQDMDSKDLPAAWVDQIELVNAPEGVSLKSDHGQITLFKRPDDLGKWGIWEWTGAGNNALWGTADNWFGQSNMPEKVTAYFGSSAKTNSNFTGGLWNGTAYAGGTVGCVVFQENAVDTFTVWGQGQTMTLSDSKVESYSFVPQVFSVSPRTTGSTLAFVSRGDAPLVLGDAPAFKGSSPMFSIEGDVRLGGQDITLKTLTFSTAQEPSGGTWFSVLSGVTCTFTELDVLYGIDCGIRVAEGGTMVFSPGTTAAQLRIDRAEHSYVVNGLMDVQIPFYGQGVDKGGRHVFRGTGRLNLTSVVPYFYKMRVVVADTLDVYQNAASWTTASDAAAGFALTARGNPTLHVADGWTYGPSGETAVALDQRQLEIEKCGVLRVDAAGGAVTFVDPFVGPGTLALTNATMTLTGAYATDAGVRVDAGATLSVAANQTVGGLSAQGGTLAVSPDAVLAVEGDVDVSELEFADVGNAWRTYVTATGTISGLATRKSIKFRTVELEGGVTALQVKNITGISIVVR